MKPEPATAPLRPASEVMRLARMGAFHQSRLSFMRVLLRRLKRDGWRFDRPLWRIDAQGVGTATYRAIGPDRTYTLVAFAHDLPPEKRSDRVIAEAWDATFTLFDGEPTEADIDRLAKNVPLQEAGRISERELSLSRANRSVRLFAHVVDRLAAGRQPDSALIEPVGYLMRTTAVYGSAKFGAADREVWADRPEFAGSFQPEMLSVWLTRAFTLDLVEHLAQAKAPDTAVTLDPDLRRSFGVGNSTGLGMAPFLMNHPALLHAWIAARETALARIRTLPVAGQGAQAFRRFVDRAAINAAEWNTEHPLYVPRIKALRADLARLAEHLDAGALGATVPWDALYRWAEANLTLEGQEQLVSLMLEPHGPLVDDLAATMSADEATRARIDGAMPLSRLRALTEQTYGWALALDFSDPEAIARVWYVSAEKLEPRLGERFEEPIEPYEQPLAPGRDAAVLHAALVAALEQMPVNQDSPTPLSFRGETPDCARPAPWAGASAHPGSGAILSAGRDGLVKSDSGPAEVGEATTAEFLLLHPEHRAIVRRVQQAARLPYAEIRDNTIAAGMLPIDLLRCKLSFFGATKFDPRSDRWVRITMYQGAPFPHELADLDPDDLAYPPEPAP